MSGGELEPTSIRERAKEERMRTVRKALKGWALGLAAAGLVVGSAQVVHASACGDLNDSGTVTTGDVTRLRRVIAGLENPATQCGGAGALQCGDIRKDGGLGSGDVVVLLNHLAGNPTIFPICEGPGNEIPSGTTISGTINSNQEWTAGAETCCSVSPNTIFIDGTVFVNSGVTITINPGTVVRGLKTSSNGTPSVLVFRKGAKINGPGRSDCPIIFTSDQNAPNRQKGDWGGVVLNGNAPSNCSGGGAGGCFAEGLTSTPFGGSDPNDSSGILRFARVEFSGIEISADNELNVFTQNGIGAATQIDHIQANVGFDDAFEWFGGTVSEKFLVASGVGDDNFDWQLATTGSFQYGLAVQYNPNLQGSGANGFEGDNNENNLVATPVSNPKFCNVTLIGTRDQASPVGGAGALIRRGTNAKIANAIFAKWVTSGIRITENETMDNACTNTGTPTLVPGGIAVRSSVLWDNTANLAGSFSAPRCTVAQWYNLQTGNNPATDGGVGTNPFATATLPYPTSVADVAQYIPVSPGPADNGTDCSTASGFGAPLENAAYIGAFQPGALTTWLDNTSCWISFATQ
jgi:hypothetical protein